MATLQNDRFLRALLRQPVDRTPLWMMRQAGRYLPEYRATRAQAGSFMGLCTQPELACEVTMQPLRRYEMDAAILFSDILTIPDAMGLGLYFTEGEGPRFERPLTSEADIAALEPNKARDELGYVMDAGGTATQTWRVRVGRAENTYPIIYVNRNSETSVPYGGAASSWMSITEVQS